MKRDYKLVWDAIKIEIPAIKPKLQSMLAELGKVDKKTGAGDFRGSVRRG